ncbi:substrate-specific component RibU of riboflavin ECF transporter [Agrilactobacillus composti DSM 18527 = JCM 14202]|uniref:ECF transporter S component n=1 Tax=Agrilactobacillus composti TaxID=398555 RepID=UPI00042DF98B|nr:ECF transporter S component [Agrilactobacillus composti]GAF39122.1 substrate-specific component RibU of riboflavin ECF transporter [Agrilactobacillus composti DSM 18527 = JCM 14202]
MAFKSDLSDLVVLIGTFIYGPTGGIAIAFVRSLLHFLTSGGNLPSLIGDTASFIASTVFLLPMYYVLRKHSNAGRQASHLFWQPLYWRWSWAF